MVSNTSRVFFSNGCWFIFCFVLTTFACWVENIFHATWLTFWWWQLCKLPTSGGLVAVCSPSHHCFAGATSQFPTFRSPFFIAERDMAPVDVWWAVKAVWKGQSMPCDPAESTTTFDDVWDFEVFRNYQLLSWQSCALTVKILRVATPWEIDRLYSLCETPLEECLESISKLPRGLHSLVCPVGVRFNQYIYNYIYMYYI